MSATANSTGGWYPCCCPTDGSTLAGSTAAPPGSSLGEDAEKFLLIDSGEFSRLDASDREGQSIERPSCRFLGRQTGMEECATCRGKVALKVFRCLHERHDQTTLAHCRSCLDYAPSPSISGNALRLLLRFPHGFGDAVQFTTVLLHLKEFYPQWSVDVVVNLGVHTMFEGLCRQAFSFCQEPVDEPYDMRRTLWWHEPDASYKNSPSTKAEKCLREMFRIEPQKRLCRYAIHPSVKAQGKAREYARELAVAGGMPDSTGAGRFVLIHYQGNSARRNKNLDERAVGALCEEVIRLGYHPVVLDWEARSSLVDNLRVFSPRANHPLWGDAGCGDGATLAALAQLAVWCVGIDSGPGHVFGATDTPTTIVWTRHHPLHYYALSQNVTHLILRNHNDLIRGDKRLGLKFFEANYRHRTYWDLQNSLIRLARQHLDITERNVRGEVQPIRSKPSIQQTSLIVDGDHWVRRRYHRPDMVIVRDVYLEDCYRVAELPRAPRFVIDVGAHIGAFAMRVRRRTTRAKTVCVEANPANLEALQANVSVFAEIVPAACTYEPGNVGLLSTVFDGSENTGGSVVAAVESGTWKNWMQRTNADAYRPEGPVAKITLEEIVQRFELPRIDLLKLDCEGSEFSILQNCDLSMIGHIVGEYHSRERFHQLIKRRFSSWNVRILKDGPTGLFWLWP